MDPGGILPSGLAVVFTEQRCLRPEKRTDGQTDISVEFPCVLIPDTKCCLENSATLRSVFSRYNHDGQNCMSDRDLLSITVLNTFLMLTRYTMARQSISTLILKNVFMYIISFYMKCILKFH